MSVQVRWIAPDNGGSAITAYQILIQKSDGSFSSQLTDCDGTSSTIVVARSCNIPISTLIVAPFNLLWGDDVYATVTAVNVYGSSTVSLAGNGAKILREPDAPVNLANDPSITSGSQIGLTWAQGIENGGTPVIDFTISYKFGTTDYVILASGIT